MFDVLLCSVQLTCCKFKRLTLAKYPEQTTDVGGDRLTLDGRVSRARRALRCVPVLRCGTADYETGKYADRLLDSEGSLRRQGSHCGRPRGSSTPAPPITAGAIRSATCPPSVKSQRDLFVGQCTRCCLAPRPTSLWRGCAARKGRTFIVTIRVTANPLMPRERDGPESEPLLLLGWRTCADVLCSLRYSPNAHVLPAVRHDDRWI